MRYIPFTAHSHNVLEGGVPLMGTSASVVHAVIEYVFEVSKEKKKISLLELRLLLQSFINIARATSGFRYV